MKESSELHQDNLKRVASFFIVVLIILAVAIHIDLTMKNIEEKQVVNDPQIRSQLDEYFGQGYRISGVRMNKQTNEVELRVDHVGENFSVHYAKKEIQRIDLFANCVSTESYGVTNTRCYTVEVYNKSGKPTVNLHL